MHRQFELVSEIFSYDFYLFWHDILLADFLPMIGTLHSSSEIQKSSDLGFSGSVFCSVFFLIF